MFSYTYKKVAYLEKPLIKDVGSKSTKKFWSVKQRNCCKDTQKLSSPEHIHLGEEGVVGDAAEEVPLAHVLGDDPVDELLQEHLEGVLL